MDSGDFNRPSRADQDSQPAETKTAKVSRSPISVKQLVILIATVLILAGLLFGGLWWQAKNADAHNPIPRSARQGLNFQLYYPSKLPAGYSVKTDSFQQKDGALIFYIDTPNNKLVGVSEQPLPSGVSLPQSSTGPIKIPGETDFYSAIGHSHISLEGANYVSETITPGGVWIIFNVNGLNVTDATALTESLVPAR